MKEDSRCSGHKKSIDHTLDPPAVSSTRLSSKKLELEGKTHPTGFNTDNQNVSEDGSAEMLAPNEDHYIPSMSENLTKVTGKQDRETSPDQAKHLSGTEEAQTVESAAETLLEAKLTHQSCVLKRVRIGYSEIESSTTDANILRKNSPPTSPRNKRVKVLQFFFIFID